MHLARGGVDYFKSLADIFKRVKKSFIIYPAWKGVNVFESLVDILKTEQNHL